VCDKKFQIVSLAITVTACAAPLSMPSQQIGFSDAMSKSLASSKRLIQITARVNNVGSGGAYSLVAPDSAFDGTACISLLLSERMKTYADRHVGSLVVATGQPLSLGFVNEATDIQNPYVIGRAIGGRSWRGTSCKGDTVLFVTDLRRSIKR
jgi:hypothetical protein